MTACAYCAGDRAALHAKACPVRLRRAKLERLAWTHKHRDMRGRLPDGTKTVCFYYPDKGTCLCPMSSLTDAELLSLLPAKIREEHFPC